MCSVLLACGAGCAELVVVSMDPLVRDPLGAQQYGARRVQRVRVDGTIPVQVQPYRGRTLATQNTIFA